MAGYIGSGSSAVGIDSFTKEELANHDQLIVDNSGNVLVGKTAIGIATDGFEARANGIVGMSDTSNAALNVNRNTTDGALAYFYKDGATVGSISCISGVMNIGTEDVALQFDNSLDAVKPFNVSTNSVRDAAIDLGWSDGSTHRRFKDLYLSGGVYLGGTGAANYLNDYEEGTWTPTFESGTWNTQLNFRYTKIGDLVFLTGYLASPSGLASDSNYQIGGLPFVGNANYNMSLLWYNGTSSTIAAGYIGSNTTTISVRPIPFGNTVNTFTELAIQLTYRTSQ